MAGMGLQGAAGAVAGFDGIRKWLADAKALQGLEQGNEDRASAIQRQAMLDARAGETHGLNLERGRQVIDLAAAGEGREVAGAAAEQAAAAAAGQDNDALEQQIDADPNLSQIQKLVFKASIRRGGSLPAGLLEQPKAPEPKLQFAPDGTVVDMRDPSLAGRNFRAPQAAKEPKDERIVTVQTMENGKPVTKYLPESQVRGQTFDRASTGAGPTLTAPMRKALVDADVGEKILTQLTGLYEDRKDPKTGATIQGAKHHIGPAEGRMRSFGQAVGVGGINPTFAEFKAASARLKNATIQAITGASMGVDEAKRIIDEIPTENDPPALWPIKAKQAMQNIQNIRAAINAQGGGATSGTADELAGAGQEFDWVDGKLVPR